jgi:hypothetical protein
MEVGEDLDLVHTIDIQAIQHHKKALVIVSQLIKTTQLFLQGKSLL